MSKELKSAIGRHSW